MRLLFVSGTTVGGSGRSQRELAAQLSDFGHDVLFLVDPASPSRVVRWSYGQLSDFAVRVDGWRAARPVKWLEAMPGRRAAELSLGGIPHLSSPIPENAFERVVDSFRPDVVVGSSILRLGWRKIRFSCAARQIKTVLYVREVEALNHFSSGVIPGDAVVANAESLCNAIRERGFECSFIPSVIETEVTRTASSRRVALTINPIESRGAEMVWQVAERLPHIPFVVQESWPLDDAQLCAVITRVESLPNVEFRRAKAPGPELYGDTRVLLVPYRIDNRPRVIAEAQANAIPVIAGDVPALVEAIGAGGVRVPLDDIAAWCEAIERLWNESETYEALSRAALEHSTRREIDPVDVARSFERIVTELVAPHVGNTGA